MILNLEAFPQRVRSYYMVAVAAMARADGRLDDREMAFLEQKIRDFELTRYYRDRVIQAARSGRPNMHQLFRKIRGTPLAYNLLLDLMMMAMSDGVVMDEERMLFHEVAEELGIPEQFLSLLVEFVHAVHYGAQLPCPDPLYEHPIQEMLNYFSEQKIPLLNNATFCVVSEEYNQRLKERLGRVN
ncbi:MAG: TerB family tellurite resistance protein [Deltaproteobacteria bacterium]|nr:TerB family tellurite resistance protein [Deltaproteobacteria bacterium]